MSERETVRKKIRKQTSPKSREGRKVKMNVDS